jgi:pimeloyl-ACP methyl ester carboxylesterase
MKVLSAFSSLFTHSLRRRGWSLAAASGVFSILTAAGCGQLAQKERELTFRIEPGTAGWYSGLPSGIVESSLPVPSDDQAGGIHTWWWPAERPDAPVLLYLHGARWNLTGHVFRIEQLREFGYSVLAIDYRGFGKSGGALPSEETVYEDARIAWRHLSTLQPDPDKRFIYGHSLGGAVAIELAYGLSKDRKEDAAAGLIVESSFTSLADVARTFSYRWLPIQLLLTQKFDSLNKIRKVDMPVLIVHGTDDPYIPAHFSKALHAAARADKRLLLVEGGTHNNSLWVGEPEYRAALAALFGWNPRNL